MCRCLCTCLGRALCVCGYVCNKCMNVCRGVPRIFGGGGGRDPPNKLTSQTSARLSYFSLGLPV